MEVQSAYCKHLEREKADDASQAINRNNIFVTPFQFRMENNMKNENSSLILLKQHTGGFLRGTRTRLFHDLCSGHIS